jgi:hypothetical protein
VHGQTEARRFEFLILPSEEVAAKQVVLWLGERCAMFTPQQPTFKRTAFV